MQIPRPFIPRPPAPLLRLVAVVVCFVVLLAAVDYLSPPPREPNPCARMVDLFVICPR